MYLVRYGHSVYMGLYKIVIFFHNQSFQRNYCRWQQKFQDKILEYIVNVKPYIEKLSQMLKDMTLFLASFSLYCLVQYKSRSLNIFIST
jgi:hypothetical protein